MPKHIAVAAAALLLVSVPSKAEEIRVISVAAMKVAVEKLGADVQKGHGQ